ncbi:hypothetical protein [Paracidovorax avenae]|uniref:hypothetical protein n=1 Tax=Paracidovorax avenae TaxID=80867 RepID=UPI00186495C0|nr:hypothetical protein [Paracidovorax avenae]
MTNDATRRERWNKHNPNFEQVGGDIRYENIQENNKIKFNERHFFSNNEGQQQ